MNDTDLISWPSAKEKTIEKYVRRFLDILSVDSQGNVSTTLSHELDLFLEILSANVDIKGVDSAYDKRNLIYMAVFNRLKRYRSPSVAGFRKALASEVRKFQSRPIRQYLVLFPLHVRASDLRNVRSITILGKKLRFSSWLHCSRKLELDKLLQETRLHLQDMDFDFFPKFTPVLISTEGKYDEEAFFPAELSFDFLRWLINIQYQFGRANYRWGKGSSPLARILPPPTYGLFDADGQFEKFFYSIRKYETYPDHSLHNDAIANARNLAKRFGNLRTVNETANLLFDAIRLYGEALDALEWRHAFLTLWQVLELITLQSKDNLNMKTVRNRASILIGQRDDYKDLLDVLCAFRNALVHKGTFPDSHGLEQVNMLKIIVEMAIGELFKLERKIKKQVELERYFQHASSPSSGLESRMDIIRDILRSRT